MHRLTLGLAMAFCAFGEATFAADEQRPATQPAATAGETTIAKSPAVKITVGPAAATISVPGKPAAPSKPAGTSPQAIVPPPAQTTWSDADIAAANTRCAAVLKGINAVVMPAPPVRSGGCGAPAPVRLITIGKNPEVALSSPPLLTCDMVATLAGWLETSVQPMAKKYLGQPIIRIDTMSDYSCRAAYGRKGNRLSEHGKANALDIRGFATAKGETALLLADWGQTKRDIAKAEAAAKAAVAAKLEKERLAAAAAKAPAPQAPPPNVVVGVPPAAVTAKDLATSAAEAVTNLVKNTFGSGPSETYGPPTGSTGHALAPPSQLGGPKPQETTVAALPTPAATTVSLNKKGRFLREIHDQACKIFGTTLGPEANEAHRNHLHVDMAERRNGLKICD